MSIERSWLEVFNAGKGSRYLRILSLVERSVADGQLQPGERLPPQRRLAELLGVDLTTVTRAYAEAKERGLVESRGPSGTFVSAPVVDFAPRIDLSMNMPPSPEGPGLFPLLQKGLAEVLARSNPDLLMTYHPGGGSRADRMAGSRWLAPMFGPLDVSRIAVCPGAQSALAALVLSLTRPGEAILAEPVVYPGLISVAERLSRRVAAVPADEHGMRPDALEQACDAQDAQSATVLYLNPTIQNPVARTMPATRRRQLAKVAQRKGLRIIEDDPYWLFEAEAQAPEPLACLAPASTYYLSTLSKCLTPGLRTAYVLLPSAHDEANFLDALRSFALMASPLPTALATQWVHDGSARHLLEQVRAEAWARHDMASAILGVPVRESGRGIHIWHALPARWTAPELARAALAEGLSVTPSAAFAIGGEPPNAVRLSLGAVRGRAQLADALSRLKLLLEREPVVERRLVI
ncbi:PLP-dependent aminotransferase family protein [Variovorax sp. E3]|uniref:aminotransferase-like domain-containing protein n=1 Tax=Variovorax sp. E3 TaxID=1914993 RepID=UPI0018DD71B7|nr:PLP-dependent aminotransferase family protein [Variovorax sp. E3]